MFFMSALDISNLSLDSSVKISLFRNCFVIVVANTLQELAPRWTLRQALRSLYPRCTRVPCCADDLRHPNGF